jgi:hypothetical protein
MAGVGASAIQPYIVLSGDRIYAAAPATRPWFGYPYAVVAADQLEAQARRPHVVGEAAFLSGGGPGANVQTHGGVGVALRVSDDYRMAIEDSDLQQRQPKHVFLSHALLTESNRALEEAGAEVRLRLSGGSISILTGWSGTRYLRRVTARYVGRDSPDRLPQNCNFMAEKVSGRPRIQSSGNNAVTGARRALYAGATTNPTERQLRDYVRRYGDASSRGASALSQNSFNQFANPGVGEVYMIATQEPWSDYDEYLDFMVTKPRTERQWDRYEELHARFSKGNGDRKVVRDFQSGENRELGWSYHFAGVVAKSGNDCVTLENYARGDGREEGADPRWYFQMYSQSKTGQSFHEANKAQGAFANPLTLTIRG